MISLLVHPTKLNGALTVAGYVESSVVQDALLHQGLRQQQLCADAMHMQDLAVSRAIVLTKLAMGMEKSNELESSEQKYHSLARQVANDPGGHMMSFLALSLKLLVAVGNFKAYRQFERQYDTFSKNQIQREQKVECAQVAADLLLLACMHSAAPCMPKKYMQHHLVNVVLLPSLCS